MVRVGCVGGDVRMNADMKFIHDVRRHAHAIRRLCEQCGCADYFIFTTGIDCDGNGYIDFQNDTELHAHDDRAVNWREIACIDPVEVKRKRVAR